MKPWSIAALLLLNSCATLWVPLPAEAERLTAKTADGWSISLVRYRAQGPSTGVPVLLCHGISANARNLDLDATHSMARYLAAHGRDAFTLSLRSTGDSDAPDRAKGRAVPTFDDFWRQDLPAAIALVRTETGASELDYVGHSMGGLIMYAYLGQHGPGIHAVATLGSPTRLNFGTGLQRLLPLAAPMLSNDAMLPSAFGAALAAPFQGPLTDSPFQRLFYDPDNTRVETWQRLMAYGTADTSGAVGNQMAKLVATGDFRSNDGAIDFRAAMRGIEVPVMVVAGRLDRIAPTAAVRDGYDALGGKKEWLLISRANGSAAEYGHMDLVVGERAPDEVWSRVLDFFTRQARQEQ